MRTRLTPLAGLLVLGSAGFVMLSLTRGQEAKPAAPVVTAAPRPLRVTLPSKTIPVPQPAAATTPAGGKPPLDLSKLSPLARQMYLSARSGARRLSAMNLRTGRFDPGIYPNVNQPVEGDHILRQGGATFALARAACYFQDEEATVHATHAILHLLDGTAVDPRNPQVRGPAPSAPSVNFLASSALLVLAINELPAPNDELLTCSEQLCNALRLRQQADGSLKTADTGSAGVEDPESANSPGLVLVALMRSQQYRPAKWKTDAVRRALPFYCKAWSQNKDRDRGAWLTAAFTEAFLRTKEKPFADAVLEMNDWLCDLQYEQLDALHPRWLGGFQGWANGRPAGGAPDVGSALCAGSLAEACRVTRQLGDLSRHERYTAALERGLQFLVTLQYSEADTQHFADWYRKRLVGGFHASHQDGTLRIDYTQHAVSALVQYLRCAAAP